METEERQVAKAPLAMHMLAAPAAAAAVDLCISQYHAKMTSQVLRTGVSKMLRASVLPARSLEANGGHFPISFDDICTLPTKRVQLPWGLEQNLQHAPGCCRNACRRHASVEGFRN